MVALQLLPLAVALKYNVTSQGMCHRYPTGATNHSPSICVCLSPDLDNCLHYIADEGYSYKKFFKIRPDMQHTRNADDLVHLKMYVHAAKDVHILLSGSVNPSLMEPVYEIVLDAGGDTYSEIRSRLRTQPLIHTVRPNVIVENEITPIVIRVTRAGEITVAVGNESEPTLKAFNANPLAVQYLSFASWRNSMWMAYFDCHSNKKCRWSQCVCVWLFKYLFSISHGSSSAGRRR